MKTLRVISAALTVALLSTGAVVASPVSPSVFADTPSAAPQAAAAMAAAGASLPVIDASFSPATIVVGKTSVLTLTITNTNRDDETDWGLVDTLPAGLVLADTAFKGTCAQVTGAPYAVTGTSGGSTITVTGADLSSSASLCTITANVTSSTARVYTNSPASDMSLTGLTAGVAGSVQYSVISCDDVWYATNTSASTVVAGTYGYIDPSQGTWHPVGQLADQSSALAVDPKGGVAYYAGWNEAASNPNGIAYRLDLTTGVSTQLNTASVGMFMTNRMAMAADGTLWTMTTNGHLWSTVPTATSVGTPVDHGLLVAPAGAGGSGALTGGDIAFDGSGNLWVITNDHQLWVVGMGSLQAGTPQGSFVGSLTSGSTNYPGLAFTTNGTMWGATGGLYSAVLYKIDPATGQATTAVGSGPAWLGDLASCAYPIPQVKATKTVSPSGAVMVGSPLTYTIKVTNTGGLAAPVTSLTDAIPAHTTYVPGSTKLNGTAVADANGGFPFQSGAPVNSSGAFGGVIAPGATATIVYDVTVDNPLPSGVTSVSNQGFVNCTGCKVVPTDWPDTPQLDDPTVTPVIKAQLLLTKALKGNRVAGSDQFTVAIHTGSVTGPIVNSTSNATTKGAGAVVLTGSGTTGVYQPTPGTTYYLTEAASGTAQLANYTATITCTDYNRLQTGLPSNSPLEAGLQITPVSGSAISCILTNTAKTVSVQINKTWIVKSPTGDVIGTYNIPSQDGDTAQSLPAGFSSTPALTGQASPAFGTTYQGYVVGSAVTVGESAVAVPSGCALASQKVTAADGAALPTAAAVPYTTALTAMPAVHTYTITNTVTCDQTVTALMLPLTGGVGLDVIASWSLGLLSAGAVLLIWMLRRRARRA